MTQTFKERRMVLLLLLFLLLRIDVSSSLSSSSLSSVVAQAPVSAGTTLITALLLAMPSQSSVANAGTLQMKSEEQNKALREQLLETRNEIKRLLAAINMSDAQQANLHQCLMQLEGNAKSLHRDQGRSNETSAGAEGSASRTTGSNHSEPLSRIGRHPVLCANRSAQERDQQRQQRSRVEDMPLKLSSTVEAILTGILTQHPGREPNDLNVGCKQNRYSRTANNLIVYINARLVAEAANSTFNCGFHRRAGQPTSLFPRLTSRPSKSGNKGYTMLGPNGICPPRPCDNEKNYGCDDYGQNYNLMRGHERRIASWFELAPAYAGNAPADGDFVIHLRSQGSTKELTWYVAFMEAREALLGPIRGTIWILSENPSNAKAVAIASQIGGKVRSVSNSGCKPNPDLPVACSAFDDFAFLMRSKRVLLGWGTFSWLAAYLYSYEKKEIHSPIWPHVRDQQAGLFVDDDPTWIYHSDEQYFLSASEVLGIPGKFLEAVNTRVGARCFEEQREVGINNVSWQIGRDLVRPCSPLSTAARRRQQ